MNGKQDSTRYAGFSVPGLNEETRKTMNSAFDAMSQWRNEMQASTERNSAQVFDRMSSAAKAMGWPPEIVETTRNQMMTMSRMQMQMMDQVMDTWEEQLKAPNPAAAMQNMMSKLNQFPMPGFGSPMAGGMPGMPGMPGMGAMGGMPMNPMQFWMQVGEQWQKNWAQAMQVWTQQAGSGGGSGTGTPRKPGSSW
jgi:hypothetical protein